MLLLLLPLLRRRNCKLFHFQHTPKTIHHADENGEKTREPFATALSGAHFKAPKRLFNGCLHQIRKTITEFHIKFIAAHSSFASFSLYVNATRLGRLNFGLLFNFVTAIFFCYSVCLRSRILMFVDSRRRQCDLMDFVSPLYNRRRFSTKYHRS